MRAADNEENWWDIIDSKISMYHDTLSFMNTGGLLFYIPAFMVHAINKVGASLATNSVLYFLAREETRNIFSVNSEWVRAIALFLVYMVETEAEGNDEENILVAGEYLYLLR